MKDSFIKRLGKAMCALFAVVLDKLYPYSLSTKCRGIKNYFYTQWIKHSLGKVGESTMIEKPCTIMGGGASRIIIGNHSCLQGHSVLACWKEYAGKSFSSSITIGDYCNIGEYNHISAVNNLTIGDGLLTGRFVTITDNNHGGISLEEAKIHPDNRQIMTKGSIVIGNNVWVGDKVTILGGISIGDNVIIAANSTVTSDLPSNCMAAGIPAKIIKTIE